MRVQCVSGKPFRQEDRKASHEKASADSYKAESILTVLCKTQFRHHRGKSARKRSRREGKSGGRMAGKVEWTDGRRQRKHTCWLWRVYLSPAFKIYLAHVQAVDNQFTLMTSLTCCSPWGHRVGCSWATEQQQKRTVWIRKKCAWRAGQSMTSTMHMTGTI